VGAHCPALLPTSVAGTVPTVSLVQLTVMSDDSYDLKAAQDRLLGAGSATLIANHAYGMFELGALYLAQQPPQIEDARLAIDALRAVVEATTGRLEENEASLSEGLRQLQLAYLALTKGPPA